MPLLVHLELTYNKNNNNIKVLYKFNNSNQDNLIYQIRIE